MIRHTLTHWIASVATAAVVAGPASANPTVTKPYQPMAVHGTIAGAKQEADRLYELYESHERTIMLVDSRKANPQSIPGPKLAAIHAQAWQAWQDAARLALMGEPAGEDLQTRFHLIQLESQELCGLYRQTPQGTKLVQQILKQLKAQEPALQNFLQQARAAADEGKLVPFEKQMEAKGVPLRALCVYLTNEEQKTYWHPFVTVLQRGIQPLNELRRSEYSQIAGRAIEDNLSHAVNFAQQADRICAQVAATGRATLGNGVDGDMSEAFAHIVSLWGNASIGIGRAIGLEWAFTNRPTVNISPTSVELKEQATKALVHLIEAATSAPPTSNFAAQYSKLLNQVTIASRRCRSDLDLVAICTPALDKLAAKERNFPSMLAAYELATREPLRWRRKFAVQRAEFLSQGYNSAQQIMYSKRDVTPTATAGFGKSVGGSAVVATNSFTSPTHWMVRDAASALINVPVIAETVVRLNPTSRTEVTTLKGHFYGNLMVVAPAEADVADLRTSLVVDDQHGPLSIDSAGAISAVELSDYLKVGGMIRDIHLESLVTRVATLPETAYVLIPLGESPDISRMSFPRRLICWRLNIEPTWVQSEFFAARVAAPTP